MAVIFHDACNTSANYSAVGANTTFGGNNGMFGSLGASGSMHIAFSGSSYVFEGAEKNLGATATIFQFWYRPSSSATLGNGNTIFTAYTDSTYSGSTAPIRIDVTPSSGSIKFSLIDPSNSYATTTGTTTFALGIPIKVCAYQTSAGWKLYLNQTTTPEVTYAHTQSPVGVQYVSWGTVYQNASGSYTGIADIDEIWCGNLNTAPSTVTQKAFDVYQGYLQNHLSAEGQPYRSTVDGVNNSGSPAIDTVSEGASYLLKLAVQNNDQASFTLCDNWILANLIRVNSSSSNTQNNPSPTTALNLMAYHYNSANTDGKGVGTIYDANWAGDAECEHAQALLWAHGLWGSSASTVGSPSELLTPNYKQRALNVLSDIRTYGLRLSSATGYYYLVNDSFQTGDPVQIAPDYNNPGLFKLAAQYDTANATIWNSTVQGAYDVLTKNAAVIFTGATPAQSSTVSVISDWVAFTLSTGTVSTTPSTYGDPNYGFNAFRIAYRLYETYVWYLDSAALSALRLPKSEWTSLYSGNSKIPATLNHDGSNLASYELTYFTYPAYFALYANDMGNSTASTINTAKLTGLYNQEPYGSIISEIPSGLQYGYFGQSWGLTGYMLQNGLWDNYGQTITVATSVSGSSAVSGTVTVAEKVTVAISGVGTLTTAFLTTESIASAVSGQGTLTAAISETIVVTATITGTSAVNAALGSTTLITTAIVGSSTVTATAIDHPALATAISGSGILSATLIPTSTVHSSEFFFFS